MRRPRTAYRAPVAVAIEDSLTNLMLTLEGIKDVHGLTDDQIAAALTTAPGINEFWREWRRRQAPLTEQIPIVEQSVGDPLDL